MLYQPSLLLNLTRLDHGAGDLVDNLGILLVHEGQSVLKDRAESPVGIVGEHSHITVATALRSLMGRCTSVSLDESKISVASIVEPDWKAAKLNMAGNSLCNDSQITSGKDKTGLLPSNLKFMKQNFTQTNYSLLAVFGIFCRYQKIPILPVNTPCGSGARPRKLAYRRAHPPQQSPVLYPLTGGGLLSVKLHPYP
jgi:hypothetical protein